MRKIRLRRPDIEVGPFRLWVDGWESPEPAWPNDSFLNIEARCGNGLCASRVSGPWLEVQDVEYFRTGLATFGSDGRGYALLRSQDAMFGVEISGSYSPGIAGGAAVEAFLLPTPEITETFGFDLQLDRLPDLIECCDQILRRYPVRGETQSADV